MIDPPECFKRGCIHYLGVLQDDEDNEQNERPHCVAFPNGIPDDIAYGDDKHTEVREDQDNNITFESAD